jgi:predicted DNA binding CopG/RHH family protein
MNKLFPRVKTDKEIEDLSDYLNPDNFSQVTFESQPKQKQVNIRMSKELLEKVKIASKKEVIPYQQYIRRSLERRLGAE